MVTAAHPNDPFAKYLELERRLAAEGPEATITCVANDFLPGLLQITEYGEAGSDHLALPVRGDDPGRPSQLIARRTDRQERVLSSPFLNLRFYIGHAALTKLDLLCTPAVARRQRQHIVGLWQQPRVSIRILPAELIVGTLLDVTVPDQPELNGTWTEIPIAGSFSLHDHPDTTKLARAQASLGVLDNFVYGETATLRLLQPGH
jgi:hypothetical protein